MLAAILITDLKRRIMIDELSNLVRNAKQADRADIAMRSVIEEPIMSDLLTAIMHAFAVRGEDCKHLYDDESFEAALARARYHFEYESKFEYDGDLERWQFVHDRQEGKCATCHRSEEVVGVLMGLSLDLTSDVGDFDYTQLTCRSCALTRVEQ
jgi:hypothetical protein